LQADEGGPMKPKATWGGEEFNNDMKKLMKKKGSANTLTYADPSPEPGRCTQRITNFILAECFTISYIQTNNMNKSS
jgi:hypothetical protein